ncbi:V-type ATP synthase subunit E family protein [Pseudoclostridium thermosuccinogenes]|uniref:V-type ATP synthase subunit E n=1 Tax=Clostridium thermosuccinogenes TaxID=84032 RepID=UPI000CCC5406|nr:V-type ATP synthase subunit E family protein [Pseudoclostridium thermosuccinogenes]PNT93597.1 hypothetical protein CDQ83_08895 [Pseudoclostridium thermosuccinogenes]
MAEVEKLISRILEDARAQANANIERAKSEADGIIDAARQKAEQKSREILEKAEKEAVEKKKRLIAVAELEARKEKLRAKQDVIEEAFSIALDKLRSMPDDKYQAILADMIANSSESGNEEIVLSERDKGRISPSFVEEVNDRLRKRGLQANIRLSEQSAAIGAGFILKSGDYELNNSFEAIVKMARDELEMEVAGLLFKE